MTDDLRIRVSYDLETTKSNENIKKKVKQVEQEINKTPLQLKIEASTGQLKQQASNYEQWWIKSLKNIEEQQAKSANSYQQWWEKSLRLKDIKDESNAKNEAQRIQQNAQNYDKWWQQALNRRTQQEESNARKLVEINSRVQNSLNSQRMRQSNQNDQVGLFQTQMGNKLNALESGSASKYVDQSALNTLRQQINAISTSSTSFAQVRTQMQGARIEFQRINTEAQNLSRNSLNIGNAFKEAFQKFPIWIGVSTVFMQTLHGLQNGVKYIVDMDSAMVDLSKVTDLTAKQMDDMRQSAIETGKELGKSSVEVMKSYAEIGRVYKDPADMKKMSEVAVMASNVTSMTADEAAKSLQTTLLTFKLGVNDASGVLDQYNELQNRYRKICGSKIFSN